MNAGFAKYALQSIYDPDEFIITTNFYYPMLGTLQQVIDNECWYNTPIGPKRYLKQLYDFDRSPSKNVVQSRWQPNKRYVNYETAMESFRIVKIEMKASSIQEHKK